MWAAAAAALSPRVFSWPTLSFKPPAGPMSLSSSHGPIGEQIAAPRIKGSVFQDAPVPVRLSQALYTSAARRCQNGALRSPSEDGTEPCLNFRASSESSYACSLNLQSAITPHIFTRIIRSMSLCFLFRLSRSSPDRFLNGSSGWSKPGQSFTRTSYFRIGISFKRVVDLHQSLLCSRVIL
jgi:hypothetical protein